MEPFKIIFYKHFDPFKSHIAFEYMSKQVGWFLRMSITGRKDDVFSHIHHHKGWFPHTPLQQCMDENVPFFFFCSREADT